MGGLNPFKKPKIDTSALEAQKAEIAKREKELAEQEAARVKKEQAALSARKGRSGRGSLLTGLETGVSGDEKRGSLG